MVNPDKNPPETPLQDEVENQAEDPETKIVGDFDNIKGSQEVVEETLEEERGDPEADEIIEEGRENVDEGEECLSDFEKEKSEKEYGEILEKLMRGEELEEKEEEQLKEIGIEVGKAIEEDERIAEWKTKGKEEKEDAIEKKNIEFKETFEFKKDKKEIIEAREEIAKKEKEINKAVEESVKRYEEMEDRFKNLLSQDGGCDILEKEDKKELMEILGSLSAVIRNEIDLTKLKYIKAELDDPEKLLEDHAYRTATIENLEKAADFFENGLENLGKEEGNLLEEFLEFLKDHPELLEAAVLIALAAVLAKPAAEAVAGAGIMLKLAGAIGAVKSVAIVGALLAGYALTDEKQRDKFMAWICGTGKVPDWAWWGSSYKYGKEENK